MYLSVVRPWLWLIGRGWFVCRPTSRLAIRFASGVAAYSSPRPSLGRSSCVAKFQLCSSPGRSSSATSLLPTLLPSVAQLLGSAGIDPRRWHTIHPPRWHSFFSASVCSSLQLSEPKELLNAFAWELKGSDDVHATAKYRRNLVRHLGSDVINEVLNAVS